MPVDDKPQRPRYATPASGVRANTQAPVDHGFENEEPTGVDTPLPEVTAKINARTKAITTQLSGMDAQLSGMKEAFAVLVKESEASRAERIAREVAAEERSRLELEARERELVREDARKAAEREERRQHRMDWLKILSPIVAALAAILAALAGAFQ